MKNQISFISILQVFLLVVIILPQITNAQNYKNTPFGSHGVTDHDLTTAQNQQYTLDVGIKWGRDHYAHWMIPMIEPFDFSLADIRYLEIAGGINVMSNIGCPPAARVDSTSFMPGDTVLYKKYIKAILR